MAVWASPPLDQLYIAPRTLVIALASSALLNYFPDYLSLLETRLIIRQLSKSGSYTSFVAWLVLDFLITAVWGIHLTGLDVG